MVVGDASMEEMRHLPNDLALAKISQRLRYGNKDEEKIKSLNFEDIPERFKVTKDGHRFLLYDSGKDDPDRFQIYSTLENLKLMSRFKHWTLDGTFRCTPTIFYQFYTIHVIIRPNTLARKRMCSVPLVYCLLTNKKYETYKRVFEVIKNHCSENPESIMTDFEMAAINAVKDVFVGVHHFGCYFHLGQALWRRVQKEGLAQLYSDNLTVKKSIKALQALAFVPLDDIAKCFYDLSLDEVIQIDPRIENIYRYFEKTYLGFHNARMKVITPARFPPATWNMRQRTIDQLPRTDNMHEAWHKQFTNNIAVDHPTLTTLLVAIQNEQKDVEKKVQDFFDGKNVSRYGDNSNYEASNRRLNNIIHTYGQRDLVSYLDSISFNLSLKSFEDPHYNGSSEDEDC